MKRFFTLLVLLLCGAQSFAQLLTWSPSFIKETDNNVVIVADATKGNQGLLNHTPTTDVYVHIGVITNLSTGPSDWKYVKTSWGTTTPSAQATYLGSNKWQFTITGNLRTYFGLTNASEKIIRIAILFRSGNGSKKLANTDGSDMYIPVYEAGLHARIEKPEKEPKYNAVSAAVNASAGDAIPVTGVSSETAKLRVLFNGAPKDSVLSGTIINTTVNAVSGDNQIVLEASNSNGIKYDTVSFFINTPVNIAPQPAGTIDGINYLPGNTSVTLVLYAPNKTRVAVIGDFNNWTQTVGYQMNRTPDGNRYWITITGLTPGVEYAFQYLIDGTIRVADIYSEKVLDPWNDQYIPASNYPSLKTYPAGQTGIVGVLQTAKPAYNWQTTTYSRPDKRNLIIYELLLRDFVAAQNWQTLRDTLSYLKRLGINTIEIMPFNEFEGNNSWGYNPDFFLAPDKMYGPENTLKQFIDVCHQNGIAVVMDIAFNHAFGLSPTTQMYWDGTNNKPAANSPYHNPDPKHPYNVGFDFNHESQATKDLLHRAIRHWLVNYKLDGFRWDLSKGFTQVNSGSNVGQWGNYDASRIAIWKRIYDSMQVASPGSYSILEHFADNAEEIELANYGMLLWGNLNYNFSEAAMGFVANSNFQGGLHVNRGWANPHLVTYMESHDEERMMYRLLNFGNSSGSYNTKSINTALKRVEMSAAFWAMMPGPKMMWQFGELGYDQSINRCPNGTINNNCRTDPKPILWNYKADANRAALYNTYSKLFALRNHPDFLPTFVTNDVSYSLGGGIKWMKVNSPSLRVMVVGNFNVVAETTNITFQTPGMWYNYLGTGTFNATGSSQSITLQPGEFYVYLDRDANLILPLDLLSFTAERKTEGVKLHWSTANEQNLELFQIQRSTNARFYNSVSSLPAQNATSGNYNYIDADEVARNYIGRLYYRLKMVDKDGNYSYSNIAIVKPLQGEAGVRIYPNPVTGATLTVDFDNATGKKVTVMIEDLSGRRLAQQQATTTAAGNAVIDVSQLSKGIYVLRMVAGNDSYTQKFVLQ